MGTFITHADLVAAAPNFSQTLNIMDTLYLRRFGNSTPHDWNNSHGFPHTTDSLPDLGNCLGAVAQYLIQNLGMPAVAAGDIVSRGAYKSAFGFPSPSLQALYASTGSTFQATWWNGNPGNFPADYTIPDVEFVLGLNAGSLQNVILGNAFVPTGGAASPPPTPPSYNAGYSKNVDEPWANLGQLEPSSIDNLAAQGGVTSYNIVEGEFTLAQFPTPDRQYVRRTIQGIADSFEYESEDIGLINTVGENDEVSISEFVYNGEANQVIHSSELADPGTVPVLANDSFTGSNFLTNRIVCEFGEGERNIGFNRNLSSSTCDDIIAIAVKDVRPFLLKSLNYEGYSAEMKTVDKSKDHEGSPITDIQRKLKPTNEIYIQHLTPSQESRVAVIKRNGYMKQFENFPPYIEIHYNAIDLTGETIAGIGSADITKINNFAKGKIVDTTTTNPYLIVTKTVPSGSTLYPVSQAGSPGVTAYRTLSDILRRPYDIYTPPSLTVQEVDTRLTVYAPGGLISVPSKKLNKPLKDGMLRSNPTGGINPSPFIDVSNCLTNRVESYQGYGRPKTIPSMDVPDPDTEENYHFLTVSTGPALDGIKQPKKNLNDSIISQTTNLTFDIVDNQINKLNQWILVHPRNKKRVMGLLDFVTGDKSNPSIITIEYNLMKGRVEELEPGTSTTKDAGITIRGRSMLMDLADQVADRDFSLIDGSPVKEIGDMGTPTVSMTLAGPGQGAIDVKPDYMQHAVSPGWKDRIVSSGNASVRNDKQTSTYYASTRALVELPIFPSMFFDVDKIFTSEKNAPLPSDKAFEMIVDCTMTAQNRASMKLTESRFGIDWGLESDIAAFTVTDQIHKLSQHSGEALTASHLKGITTRPVIRCQKPEMTAVITAFNQATGVITVDDATAFSGFGTGYITIGEGALADPTTDTPLGYVGQFTLSGTNFTPTSLLKIFSMKKEHRISEVDSRNGVDATKIVVGMTVMAGGYAVQSPAAASSGWDLEFASASTLTKGTIAANVKAALDKLLAGVGGSALLYQNDPSGCTYYYLGGKGPDMEAFDYDVDEVLETYNDRNIVQGIDCRPNFVSLKGKSSDGNSLLYVLPQLIKFSEIVSANRTGFVDCVSEVIRRINVAGHPDSLNSLGGSAFDPLDIGTGTAVSDNTGSHMGYVRAFIGDTVESVDGETGVSIVIHSTVPGASGRNFAVWLNNNSPYPYRPQQAFGFGGLLTNNSRHYQSSSFPAPLPLGFDGETYIPITTFNGPLHGDLLKQKDGTERHYNGIGGSAKCKIIKPIEKEDWNENTIADDVMTNVGILPRITSSTNSNALYGTGANSFAAFSPALTSYGTYTAPIVSIAVDFESIELGLRLAEQVSSQNKGILRINGRLAHFEGITSLSPINDTRAENAMWITDITPFTEVSKFYESLFVDENGTMVDRYGLDVEILYPSIDSQGILFFGGGHTGVTLDISDGTDNDYSDRYKHHLSVGPTGFSGFQNIAEVSKASAVLDFTNLKDSDTYHGFTYVGKHHTTDRSLDSEPKDDCIIYIPMCEPNDLPAGLASSAYTTANTVMAHQDGTVKATYPQNEKSILKEEIYGNKLNYNSPHGNSLSYRTGIIGDWIDTPITLEPYTASSPYTKTGYSYVAAHDYDASAPAGSKILPLVKGYGSDSLVNYVEDQGAGATSDYLSSTNYTISFWVQRTKPLLFAAKGPVIHGIDVNGNPWGISLAGVANTNSAHQWNICMHINDGAAVQPRFATLDLQAYALANSGNYPQMTVGQWYHVVMSYSPATGPKLYFGQKGSSLADLSAHLITPTDALYDAGSGFANSVDGNVTNSYPYASNPGTPSFDGVADHPFVFLANGPASTVNSSFALREKGMVTIAQALHGPARHPAGYYWDQQPTTPSMQSGTPDTVPETDNHNKNGPIFFTNGSLAHIGVWNRVLAVDEAQGLHNAANQW